MGPGQYFAFGYLIVLAPFIEKKCTLQTIFVYLWKSIDRVCVSQFLNCPHHTTLITDFWADILALLLILGEKHSIFHC